MTPNELRRASQLWDVLQVLPKQARDTWIAALPENEQGQASALRAMLGDQASGLTDPLTHDAPALAAEPDAATDHVSRDRREQFGPYRLLRFRGRCGMGARTIALLAKAEREVGRHAIAQGLIQEVDAIWSPNIKLRPDGQLAGASGIAVVARTH